MDFIRKIIGNHSSLIIIITLIITFFFAFTLKDIRIENVSDKFGLPPDDNRKIEFEKFRQLFGYDEFLIIAIQSDSALTQYSFEVIDHLTNELSQLNGIDSVISLSNALIPSWTSNDLMTLSTIPTYAYYLQNGKNIEKVLNIIKDSDLIKGKLISNDLRNLLIILYLDKRFETNTASNTELQKLSVQIKNKIGKFNDKFLRFHFAGSKLIDLELQKILERDIILFTFLSVIISVIILFIFLRNWRAVLPSIFTAIIAVIWSLGIISITKTSLSLALSMIVPIILINSIESSIHYLYYIFNRSHFGDSNEDLFKQILTHYLKPNVLAGVTTLIGFASIAFSRLEGIREVGIYFALGMLFTIILNNVFLLAVIKRMSNKIVLENKLLKNAADPLNISALNVVLKHYKKIIFVSLIVLVFGFLGAFKLKSDTNHLLYIDKETNLRKSFSFIDKNFGGVLPVEIIIKKTITKEANFLDKVDLLKHELRTDTSIGSVTSAFDYLKYVLKGSGVSLKSSTSQASMLSWLADNNYLKNWIKHSGDTLYFRMSCLVKIQGSKGLQLLLDKINVLSGKYFTESQYNVVGLVSYLLGVNNYIIKSFLYAFISAFTIVFLILFLISGSIRLGVLVMFSNSIPIITTIAIMGWFNIALDVSTVMIASVLIGITVNDTIFFIYRIKEYLQKNETVKDAISKSYNIIGAPIIITSVVLAAGFLVMVFSGFIPTRIFGFLSGGVILFALFSDLLLLPSLINFFYSQSDNKTYGH